MRSSPKSLWQAIPLSHSLRTLGYSCSQLDIRNERSLYLENLELVRIRNKHLHVGPLRFKVLTFSTSFVAQPTLPAYRNSKLLQNNPDMISPACLFIPNFGAAPIRARLSFWIVIDSLNRVVLAKLERLLVLDFGYFCLPVGLKIASRSRPSRVCTGVCKLLRFKHSSPV